ncbi:uncharacterized protein LOC133520916 [Cydia pomonella]|uniref:uncharacterized protein LOC133520916 n=1 Tax=Cydia pomonella TaxID=82600 RepID=UPI002ADE396D|nr:uncharacterized protein LOC133520916 [Cydia pomonella]XP_061711583.1 uncharacterized protein LOC133520916 [Cydia pomonella]XP_061711585.1 uncharacterized protein LOC133520916 [Cydia pomonella]XP_061711586.1 uncharacterized protein LOC133520916 [Cydia pomonella]
MSVGVVESDSGDCLTDSNSEDYTDTSTDGSNSSCSSDVESNQNGPSYTKQSRKKVTLSMQDILREMVRKRMLLGEQEMVLTYAVQDVDNDYEKNTVLDVLDHPTDNLKLFASFLHSYSPDAYQYIRENYNTPLPSIKVLGSWLENDKFNPGFTKQAFEILEKRGVQNGKRQIFSLVADHLQMFVRNRSVNVDVGAGHLDGDFDDETEGREAYVILIVSLEENWKIPVCYLMSDNSLNSRAKANFIMMCLHRSHEVGVDIVSITTTTSVAKALGGQLDSHRKLKTTFKHPVSGDPVTLFVDPTLSLRSLYQTICSKKVFFNGQKGKICQNFIEQLGKILSKKTFQFNFSTDMLDLRNMLLKIDLISELMLPSLGTALEICKNRLKLPNFADSGPTIEYITMINTLYYILFSKVGQSGYKQPISQENGKEIIEFLDESKKYISSLSYEKQGIGKQLAVEDPHFIAEGFKGLLISIESLKHLYNNFVAKGIINCIPSNWLSWDQMDEFFAIIRKLNPREDASKFQKIYTRFFDDLKSSITGCIQIESAPANLSKTLKVSLDAIKKSSGKHAFDESYSVVKEKRRKTEDDQRAFVNTTKFVKLLDKGHDKMEKYQMIGYIAGYMAVELAKYLRCEECIDGLVTNEKLWFHKNITSKELKGVCLPSEELFRICWECERSLCIKMNTTVQRRLFSRALSLPPATHRIHHVYLTKAVMAKYLHFRRGQDEPRKTRSAGLCNNLLNI